MRGVPKIGVPQAIHFSRIFQYIHFGIPPFIMETPIYMHICTRDFDHGQRTKFGCQCSRLLRWPLAAVEDAKRLLEGTKVRCSSALCCFHAMMIMTSDNHDCEWFSMSVYSSQWMISIHTLPKGSLEVYTVYVHLTDILNAKTPHSKEVPQQTSFTAKKAHSKEASQQIRSEVS